MTFVQPWRFVIELRPVVYGQVLNYSWPRVYAILLVIPDLHRNKPLYYDSLRSRLSCVLLLLFYVRIRYILFVGLSL